RGNKDGLSWQVVIPPDSPVTFKQSLDKNKKPVIPRLSCAIQVEQRQHELPPFQTLDIAIEIVCPEKIPVARWHVDRANFQDGIAQSGPLVHLQFGGHNAGYRHLDHPLKEPRWCHPPMDLILLCELIVAN